MLSYGRNGPSRDMVTSAELVSRQVGRARFPVTGDGVPWDLAAAGIRLDLDGLHVHCGGSDPRYAEIAIMSSSERFETTFFISAAAVPALDPFWMQMSCRAI